MSSATIARVVFDLGGGFSTRNICVSCVECLHCFNCVWCSNLFLCDSIYAWFKGLINWRNFYKFLHYLFTPTLSSDLVSNNWYQGATLNCSLNTGEWIWEILADFCRNFEMDQKGILVLWKIKFSTWKVELEMYLLSLK